MTRQPSFRRILILRIIVVSIPVLMIGVAFAFRRARDTLLDTARQNLTESASRKAKTIENTIQALQTNLVTASETLTLRSGTLDEAEVFLANLTTQLPLEVSCLQLAEPTGQPLAGTCNIPLFGQNAQATSDLGEINRPWPQTRRSLTSDRFYIHSLDVKTDDAANIQERKRPQLNLVVSTPVYDTDEQLRYVLLAQGNLTQTESGAPGSLLGYTVVIEETGTILAHPLPNEVGQNISDSLDSSRFNIILRKALQGDQDAFPLRNFSGNNVKWLAGYSSAQVAISPTEDETWVVLAVAKLNTALYGLNNIKRILLILTGGLTLAHLLAMLYMARDLARPIEQLEEYARRIHDRRPNHAVPKNFQIRELNQLSRVLDNMVKRLEDRAKELETAWQEAQAANQLKNEFLANTSHELRTPLNAIIGCVRLVKDDLCDSPEEEIDLLEKADEAAIHLLKIINDILDIAKIESGTSTISREDVNLAQTIREVIALQAVEAHQKGLSLASTPGPSVTVYADPAKLKQIFLNLVYNAIKFTEQGGITIKTEIKDSLEDFSDSLLSDQDEDEGQQWAVISISDTGIGIDPNQQHKLFKPFAMADGSKTRKYGGTGLGLAISRNLIELMDGWITLYSEGLEKGTTVKVALPVIQILELEPTKVELAAKPEEETLALTDTVQDQSLMPSTSGETIQALNEIAEPSAANQPLQESVETVPKPTDRAEEELSDEPADDRLPNSLPHPALASEQ
ncbi:MAG: ATP-binding protein [Cyanobacteria bacterium P01_F01_bin.150]